MVQTPFQNPTSESQKESFKLPTCHRQLEFRSMALPPSPSGSRLQEDIRVHLFFLVWDTAQPPILPGHLWAGSGLVIISHAGFLHHILLFGHQSYGLKGKCYGSDGKESACKAGVVGPIPGWERSPGEGNGNPLQYSCLEIPWTEEPGGLKSMGSQKSWTWLSD